MHAAKTVCTAGVRLWQAKHPPLLVLGNFTLASQGRDWRTPGACWPILPGILVSVPECTLPVGVVAEDSTQAC